jgi:S-adenosylmethionine:tRNA ribosyltransferase-isomerase
MQDDFSLESYDYELPEQNIAQHPSEKRDGSKLFVLKRTTQEIQHKNFSDIVDYFEKGDILVVNDTKVFPARLSGKKETGGKAEVFLLGLPVLKGNTTHNTSNKRAEATVLIKSSKRPKIGSTIFISDSLQCRVLDQIENGQMRIELEYPAQLDIMEILIECGTIPLPPYIERASGTSEEDRERYQTVYAKETGAVAAPTAGLHFTSSILAKLQDKGVEFATVTLHVGYGTFAPVRNLEIRDHRIHKEYITISAEAAAQVNRVKREGGKVWAVGTTTVRELEFCCDLS